MKDKAAVQRQYPSVDEIEHELARLKAKRSWRRALRSTIQSLIVVAAVAVLIAVLILPVLRVTGTSMEPNLLNGDVLVGVKSSHFETGQICCFHYNNKILLKRVIGRAGDWVDMDETGYVFVNGSQLEEPYVQERGVGITDVTFPLQVPEGKLFVMGDHRATSVDSRSTTVGFVDVQSVVGKMLYRVWPLSSFGSIQ